VNRIAAGYDLRMTSSGVALAEPAFDGPQPASLVATFRDATCLPALRGWLRAHLAEGTDARSDAELVCTELVTNAVEHAHGPRAVRITMLDTARLRIEVDDAGSSRPTLGRSRFGSVRGRGLTLVDAVSRWGVRGRLGGKTVWATLGH
jgi:anti-sigma regulatory factor (Ser/Thr protein kinase)